MHSGHTNQLDDQLHGCESPGIGHRRACASRVVAVPPYMAAAAANAKQGDAPAGVLLSACSRAGMQVQGGGGGMQGPPPRPQQLFCSWQSGGMSCRLR